MGRLVARHTSGEGVDKLKPMVRKMGDQMKVAHAKAMELNMAVQLAAAKVQDFQNRQVAINKKLKADTSEDLKTQHHLQKTARYMMMALGGAAVASLVALHGIGGPIGVHAFGTVGEYCHATFGMGAQHTLIAGTMPLKGAGFYANHRVAGAAGERIEYDQHLVSSLASLEKPIDSWLRSTDQSLQEVKQHLLNIMKKDDKLANDMDDGEEEDFLQELDQACKKVLLIESTSVLDELDKLDQASDKLYESTTESRVRLVTQDISGRLVFDASLRS